MTLVFSSVAFATPASDINLKYDLKKNVLHISAKHPTDRKERYYIRRVMVYDNDVMVKEVTFPRQKNPVAFEEDIELTAVTGDRIRVEMFSSEGGKALGEYIVEPSSEKKIRRLLRILF